MSCSVGTCDSSCIRVIRLSVLESIRERGVHRSDRSTSCVHYRQFVRLAVTEQRIEVGDHSRSGVNSRGCFTVQDRIGWQSCERSLHCDISTASNEVGGYKIDAINDGLLSCAEVAELSEESRCRRDGCITRTAVRNHICVDRNFAISVKCAVCDVWQDSCDRQCVWHSSCICCIDCIERVGDVANSNVSDLSRYSSDLRCTHQVRIDRTCRTRCWCSSQNAVEDCAGREAGAREGNRSSDRDASWNNCCQSDH